MTPAGILALALAAAGALCVLTSLAIRSKAGAMDADHSDDLGAEALIRPAAFTRTENRP